MRNVKKISRILLFQLLLVIFLCYSTSTTTAIRINDGKAPSETSKDDLPVTSDDRKNVLLLLADDGGFEMGAYRNKIVQTPNLDRLAKKSLIFNNAFTSVSSCSPSRAAILTGLPSHQNGMYGLHQGVHHFNGFNYINSLPMILRKNGISSGIIGKKHVGPSDVFKFDYERTEEQYPVNQVGRNITQIKLFVREFLENYKNEQFFLMISFHDPHRCGRITPQYGSFCERWGSGEEGMGLIPDWHPIYYVWDEIDLPYYVQDTEQARRDIAAQYTTISRLDQGVGLVLKELENSGLADNTLVMYTSDNGPPLPSGRTNLYDPGVREPFFLHAPKNMKRQNQVTYSMTSLNDITPTVLDWFQISYPNTSINPKMNSNKKKSHSKRNLVLTGKSLLPLLDSEPNEDNTTAVFMSQTFHEVTMSYPMRAIRTKHYKLIHNINYHAPFPIDQDFYMAPTFQDILNRTQSKQSLPWYKNLREYYYRPEWELYDLRADPAELKNLAGKQSVEGIQMDLEKRLNEWLELTNDPWRCAPHAVLQDAGPFKNDPQCLSLGQMME
uniref:CSON006743 protein n=1 Tax=Culicoides sonorensis TaxID=179676 RepID=A0A336KLZ7_CULSO